MCVKGQVHSMTLISVQFTATLMDVHVLHYKLRLESSYEVDNMH